MNDILIISEPLAGALLFLVIVLTATAAAAGYAVGRFLEHKESHKTKL